MASGSRKTSSTFQDYRKQNRGQHREIEENKTGASYGLNPVPQNSFLKALTPSSYSVMVFGDETYKEVIKFKWG